MDTVSKGCYIALYEGCFIGRFIVALTCGVEVVSYHEHRVGALLWTKEIFVERHSKSSAFP